MTLPRRPVTASPDKIRETGADLVGTIDLAVPVYSAVHVGGRRLYELARSGVPVSPPVRPAVIHALEILEICLPPHDRASRVRFRVRCAPGTYVRALTAEWGRRLECGAVLERLTRTRSGPFAIERAITLDKLRELAGTDGVRGVIVPADDALAHLPRASFDDSGARRLRQGQAVPAPGGFEAGSLVRLVLADGLIGVGRVDSDGKHPIVLRPERMISEG
jgi:tRNA pseudouridine55 synthase